MDIHHIWTRAGGAIHVYAKKSAKGFIQRSTSPMGVRILFVWKKDRSIHVFIEYRALNQLTMHNRYPMPFILELLDYVRSPRSFTKLDIWGTCNLVHRRPGDEWKTTFHTQYGHFEYLMPFGWSNTPDNISIFHKRCVQSHPGPACDHLLWWYTGVFWESWVALPSGLVRPRKTMEAWFAHQTREVYLHSGHHLVIRSHYVVGGHPDGPTESGSSLQLDNITDHLRTS